MMAWIRTGTSLITFGFSVYKFFALRDEAPRPGIFGPRPFAFMMILSGLLALMLAGLQNRRELQSLRSAGADIPYSFSTLVGAFVSIFGLAALLAVVFDQ